MKRHFFTAGQTGFMAGAVLIVSLTGCVGYVHGPDATVEAQDDYFYYPGYGVYYSNHRHQYLYQDQNTWVSRPAPIGVTVEALQASPSVKMDFHDTPAHHHADVVQKYPKTWTPAGSNPGQKENPQAGMHDERGDNNGK